MVPPRGQRRFADAPARPPTAEQQARFPTGATIFAQKDSHLSASDQDSDTGQTHKHDRYASHSWASFLSTKTQDKRKLFTPRHTVTMTLTSGTSGLPSPPLVPLYTPVLGQPCSSLPHGARFGLSCSRRAPRTCEEPSRGRPHTCVYKRALPSALPACTPQHCPRGLRAPDSNTSLRPSEGQRVPGRVPLFVETQATLSLTARLASGQTGMEVKSH